MAHANTVEGNGEFSTREINTGDQTSIISGKMAEGGLVHADYLTQGVPVSVLDDEYGRSTVALGVLIEKFSQLDLYDKERPAVRSWPCFT